MTNDTVTAWSATGRPHLAPELWDAPARARGEQTPRTLPHVEDALCRYHLPMTRAMARVQAPDAADPEAVGQTAEVGLAQAILAWRRRDSAGFDRFARATITAQPRRHDRLTTPKRKRSVFGPPPPGQLPRATSEA